MPEKPTYEEMAQRVSQLEKEAEALTQLEKRLRAKNVLADAALNAQKDTFFMFEISSGRSVRWNEAFGRISGYNREEIFSMKTPDSFYREVDLEKAAHAIEQTVKEGTATVELSLITRDGHAIPTEYINSLIRDENGASQYIISVGRDITARKKTEEALRESEERLRATIEAIADPIVVYNDKGHPQYLNPAFTQVFGWTLDELKNKRIPFVPADQQKATSETIAELYRTGLPVKLETRRWTRDGSIRNIVISAAFIRAPEGKSGGMVVNLTDITEKTKLEAQLQQSRKMEAIGQLAGGVAHDFNNMLSPILGFSELILEGLQQEDERYGQMIIIKKAAERSRDLVQQLLAFSRKQPLSLQVVDVRKIIDDMKMLLRRTLREDIHLHYVLPPEPCMIKADVRQVEQILINIAMNAQDAMPEGGALNIEIAPFVLDLEYAASHPDIIPGPYVMLAISDSGEGMDDKIRGEIFNPFFTTKSKGTGLGLATVYGIVKQHNGHISVYSEPGKGTVFKIFFPATADESAFPDEVLPPAKKSAGTATILVVEDNDMVRDLACTILKNQGYQVYCAESGPEALALVASETWTPNLLLTDVVMPGMNGKQLFEKLSTTNQDLKALFMSGYTGDVIINRGVLDKKFNFIQKPFSVQGLASKVREALGQA
jgi:PAS domain S-box-containing protein